MVKFSKCMHIYIIQADYLNSLTISDISRETTGGQIIPYMGIACSLFYPQFSQHLIQIAKALQVPVCSQGVTLEVYNSNKILQINDNCRRKKTIKHLPSC